MHNRTRLERLEEVIHPQTIPKYVQAYMHFDDRGACASLEMEGRTYTPSPGESEDELCERAKQEAGRADHHLMLIQH